jgi:hypothetical protein
VQCAVGAADRRARHERAQAQRGAGPPSPQRRVDRVEHLEPAVEAETVHEVGGHPAAGRSAASSTLTSSRARQHGGGAQAREARADDHDVEVGHASTAAESASPTVGAELVAGLLELRGHGALAVQQQLLAHRAEHGLDHDGGDGERRRPVDRLGERLGELRVGDGRRPGEVDRADDASFSSTWRMPPTSSSSEIHGMYWVPGPSRPPRNA